MRKTIPTIQVALELLKDPTTQHWGYDLARRTGLKHGVLYPILTRMLTAQWLTDGWETPTQGGKPPRRFYRLTATGGVALEVMVDEARHDRRFTHLTQTHTTNPAQQENEK